MSFAIAFSEGFNPFMWESLRCPVCGEGDFILFNFLDVFCAQCRAKFKVYSLDGYNGYWLSCFADGELYAPAWKCTKCQHETAFMDWQEPECPKEHSEEDSKMVRTGQLALWEPPPGYPTLFHLLLIIGETCEGWVAADGRDRPWYRIEFPTNTDWEQFQRQNNLKSRKGAWIITELPAVRRDSTKGVKGRGPVTVQ